MILSLLLAACEDEPCARYAAMPDAWALCLARGADELADAAAVAEWCGGPAKPVEAQCRRRWVEAHVAWKRIPTADLLGLCGADEECRMQVLDARPAGELKAELETCVAQVPSLRRDCAAHAVERWAVSGPAVDAMVDARFLLATDPDLWEEWVGVALRCGGHAACDGRLAEWPVCARSLEAANARSAPCRARPTVDRVEAPRESVAPARP